MSRSGAHYAISSVFRAYPEDGELFCFDVHRDSHEVFTSGRGKVALGRGTHLLPHHRRNLREICYAVLHLGDQNLSAAVRRYTPDADETAFGTFSVQIRAAMRKANLPEVIRLIDKFFAPIPGSSQDRRRQPPRGIRAPHRPQPHRPAARPG